MSETILDYYDQWSHQAVEVDFSTEEKDLLDALVLRRHSNHYDDEGKHWYEDERKQSEIEEQERCGVYTEAALAKWAFGDITMMDMTIKPDGDGGLDNVINGLSVDIKGSTYGVHSGHNPHLLVKMKHVKQYENTVDAYVFGVLDNNNMRVRLVGWIPYDEFREKAEYRAEGSLWTENGTYIPMTESNLVARPEDLRPMEELLTNN